MTAVGPNSRLAVLVLDESFQRQAETLSKALRLPLVNPAETQGFHFLLTPTGERLELRPVDNRRHGAVFADLLDADIKRRIGGGRKQPLARACGLQKLRNPRVLDATAGLGRDGIVLAGLGCQVSLFERARPVAALLDDALRRAHHDESTRQWLQDRMTLSCEDARDFMTQHLPLPATQRHDVVFLDPMYPHRDKTALARKEMRVLRSLVGDDDDAGALLKAALAYAARRVVVKRPPWAAPIEEQTPDHQIKSKLARYDVYITEVGDS